MSVSGTKDKSKHELDNLDKLVLKKLSGAYAETMTVYELSGLVGLSVGQLEGRLSKLVDNGLVERKNGLKLTDIGLAQL